MTSNESVVIRRGEMMSSPRAFHPSNGYHGHYAAPVPQSSYHDGSSYHERYNNNDRPPGFSGFQKRLERIDWRKIASVDVEKISKELDFEVLQENILNITFCSIEAEVDVGQLDPNFVKLFKMAQFTIEYLLHSQEYLSYSITQLEEKLQKAIKEHNETKQEVEKQKSDMNEIKKESKKRKKLLEAQQQIMQSGTENYHKCPFCPKAFMNVTFLQSHITRRHGNGTISAGDESHITRRHGNGTIFAGDDVSVLPSNTKTADHDKKTLLNTALENELKEIRERLQLTESQLKDERETRNNILAREKLEQSQREQERREEYQSREEQMSIHKSEIEATRNMFMKEMKELSSKYELTQQALAQAQQDGTLGKVSNLGTLQDDLDLGDEIVKYREEVAKLREDSRKQIEQEESTWEKRVKDMEAKSLGEMRRIRKEHSEEMKKANLSLENLKDSLRQSKSGRKRDSDLSDQIEQLQTQMREQKKRSKMDERKIREQEQILNEFSSRPPAVLPRKSPPPDQPNVKAQSFQKQTKESDIRLQSSSPQKVPKQTEDKSTPIHSSQKAKTLNVPEIREQPPTDNDESIDETDRKSPLESTGGDESSDLELSSLEGTKTDSGTTSGEMTLTLTSNTLRLRQAIKDNPNIVKALKQDMVTLLDEKLQQRGIKPDAKGLSNTVYKNKVEILKKERQAKAKNISNFFDIRQQYMNQADQLARDRLRGDHRPAANKKSVIKSLLPKTSSGVKRSQNHGENKTIPASASKSPAKTPSRSRVSTERAQKAAPRSHIGSSNSGPPLKKARPYEPPKPAPRAQSPDKPLATSTLTSTGSSIERSRPSGSSKWDSDEDDSISLDDEDLVDDDSPVKKTTGAGFRQLGTSSQSRAESELPDHPQNSDGNEDEDWDSEISDLDNLSDEDLKPVTSSKKSTSSPAVVISKPKGKMVSQLTRSIEAQLMGRASSNKPTGGVDTMKLDTTDGHGESPITPDIPEIGDNDDDNWSSGSISLPPTPPPGGATKDSRKPQHKISQSGDTDYSTNTYGTSMWGSSSTKAVSSTNPKTATSTQGQGSVGTAKSSLASVTDWDSDDLDDL